METLCVPVSNKNGFYRPCFQEFSANEKTQITVIEDWNKNWVFFGYQKKLYCFELTFAEVFSLLRNLDNSFWKSILSFFCQVSNAL